jgi:hypothetical protein
MMNKKVKPTATSKTKKTAALTPRQKALDKNKNGKIDGGDFALLRKKK